ncbi:MAG: ribosome silencing factor [Saprospiraceae bacterium]
MAKERKNSAPAALIERITPLKKAPKAAKSPIKTDKKVKPEPKAKESKILPKDPLNDLIVDTILDKKGHHISLMDLRGLDGPADFFIVCEADNITLTKALSEHIYRSVKSSMGITPNHIEGASQAKWILVDYFTTIVHIFYKDTRKYYEIDQLWSDAKTVEFHQV